MIMIDYKNETVKLKYGNNNDNNNNIKSNNVNTINTFMNNT